MSVDIAVVAIHTQSGMWQKYWYERRHCSCGNDIFQTLDSMSSTTLSFLKVAYKALGPDIFMIKC